MVIKFFNGIFWKKIYYHNLTQSSYFNQYEWYYNLDPNKFSLLGSIERIKPKTEKYYRFLLEYPEYEGFNIWEQAEAPDDLIQPQNSTHFECLNCTWYYQFGPIRRTFEERKNTALYNCNTNATNWWYPFGVTSYHNNTLPGPLIDPHGNSSVYYWQYHKEVVLWQQTKVQLSQYTESYFRIALLSSVIML